MSATSLTYKSAYGELAWSFGDSREPSEWVAKRWDDKRQPWSTGNMPLGVSRPVIGVCVALAADRTVIERFDMLVTQWRKQTGGSSLMIERAMHPAYQKIIGMGKPAVPLLLKELQDDPDDWFWALESITGDRPTRDEDAGDLERMAQSWIEWGKRKGYIR